MGRHLDLKTAGTPFSRGRGRGAWGRCRMSREPVPKTLQSIPFRSPHLAPQPECEQRLGVGDRIRLDGGVQPEWRLEAVRGAVVDEGELAVRGHLR